jgi:hypothetical protein
VRAIGGTGIVPVPFLFGQGLANRKAANSGGLKVGSGEDPSPGSDLEEHVGYEGFFDLDQTGTARSIETVISVSHNSNRPQ